MTILTDTPYRDLADCYDLLFTSWGKDYKQESRQLVQVIRQYKYSPGNSLLDLGCGTGGHIQYLQDFYNVYGVDASEEMLTVAREKCSGIPFYCMDMANLSLENKFDVIVSLFSAIGYVCTVERLNQTIQAISKHLLPGGIAIIEPWFTPEEFEIHRRDALFGEFNGAKACRMRESVVEGKIATIQEHILISINGCVKYLKSEHVFGLFSLEDFHQAFQSAGLRLVFIKEGITGRGLYVGVKDL